MANSKKTLPEISWDDLAIGDVLRYSRGDTNFFEIVSDVQGETLKTLNTRATDANKWDRIRFSVMAAGLDPKKYGERFSVLRTVEETGEDTEYRPCASTEALEAFKAKEDESKARNETLAKELLEAMEKAKTILDRINHLSVDDGTIPFGQLKEEWIILSRCARAGGGGAILQKWHALYGKRFTEETILASKTK